MATNVAGARGVGAHRPDSLVTLEKTVNYNTTGISAGVFWFRIPARAQITRFLVNVETVFNGGDTNVLTVGYGASLDELAGAGDINEASATAQAIATALSLEFTEEKAIFIKYAQTGTAATTGKARFVIDYVPCENYT